MTEETILTLFFYLNKKLGEERSRAERSPDKRREKDRTEENVRRNITKHKGEKTKI